MTNRLNTRSPLVKLMCLGAALTATAALAQEAPEISFKSTEIEPGIFMVEGVGGFGGGNMAVLVQAKRPGLRTLEDAIEE